MIIYLNQKKKMMNYLNLNNKNDQTMSLFSNRGLPADDERMQITISR